MASAEVRAGDSEQGKKLRVVRSSSIEKYVRYSPPMPGLPPIEGEVTVTMQLLDAPVKAAEIPPVKPGEVAPNSEFIARLKTEKERCLGQEMIFLSVTVYDSRHSLVRVFPGNRNEDAVTAWSNVDFQHFSGVNLYQVFESDLLYREVGVLMGVGKSKKSKPPEGGAFTNVPDLGELSVVGPHFRIIEGPQNGAGFQSLRELHQLYRLEGSKMEDEWRLREEASQARRQGLLANPPEPEDIRLRFWQREGNESAKISENGGAQ